MALWMVVWRVVPLGKGEEEGEGLVRRLGS